MSSLLISTFSAVGPVTAAVDPGLGYDPSDDGSMSMITRITGAQAMWDAGFTGQGVDVALIDTGVARVPGLDQPGKVIDGPDLSFDSQEPVLTFTDAFGHGTHMAGIIAGSDVAAGTTAAGCTTCLGTSAYTDTTKFVGVAPDARIVNVKAGAYDGSVDVTQVIAAIYWVIDHRNDPGVNIRVLNLSYGTDSTQDPAVDPLVRAVEAAWDAGIVVVVAAGNEGKTAPTLGTPATSPVVIAVGSTDARDSTAVADDSAAVFAQHGTAARGVDFATPGVSVISLRVPGGFVDGSVGTGRVGTRFQRASGTSQSTAVVSGLAALLISKYPSATPDQIKTYLRTNALPVKKTYLSKGWFTGAGSASVAKAVTMAVLPAAATAAINSTGSGTIEGSRGSSHVTADGIKLTGEMDIFAQPWTAPTAGPSGTTWIGGIWNGVRWTGDSWEGVRWTGVRWTGVRWTGVRWTDSSWDGVRWTDAAWTDSSWDGVRWTDAAWTGVRWTDAAWTGVRWTGVRWTDAAWDGVRWTGARWS